MNQEYNNSVEFASFGIIHLNNTSLEKSSLFWTKIVGMKRRKYSDEIAEFGTETQTLVVVHETAITEYQKGYSGLYHFAIHAPNPEEFASMLHRLMVFKYPYSPVDHTMSQSIYLMDPDGITIEFTLETPERFKRVVTQGGFRIEDSEGKIRSASAHLDENVVLDALVEKDVDRILSNDTVIGHLHLYVNHLGNSKAFYQKLGFIPFNDFPQFMFLDMGAGGAYKHRIAMNTWHGINRPLAPSENAGLNYFQIIFHSKEKLDQALNSLSEYEEKEDGYWIYDPTGNKICIN